MESVILYYADPEYRAKVIHLSVVENVFVDVSPLKSHYKIRQDWTWKSFEHHSSFGHYSVQSQSSSIHST